MTGVECFKEGTCDLVGSILKLFANIMDLVFKFLGRYSHTTLHKRSWNNWLVLKMTDSSNEKD